MDTDALRWFQQVADGETVTQVGDLEHVTQSGISRALARLEAEVGTPLLQRSGRTLRMTRAGVAFKHHVDALLHQLDDGLAAVDQLIDPETGTVTLTYQPSLGTWLVPDLIGSFRAEHPDVRFDLVPKRDDAGAFDRARAGVDLEITTRRPVDPAVQWRRLGSDPLRLAVAEDHALAGRPRTALADAAEEAFVTLRPTAHLSELLADLCSRAGFRPRVAFEADDLPSVEGLVAAGMGVALVPALRGDARAAAARPIVRVEVTDPGARREIVLAWSAERRPLPSAALFRQHVLDRAAARLLPPVADGDPGTTASALPTEDR